MSQPVVHYEIVGPDAKVLQDYYRSLFDWKINADNPMNYGMVEPGEGGIAGGVGPSPDGPIAKVLDEAVTVRIEHKVLRDLQVRVSSVDHAWNALHGQRLGEFRRARALQT